MKAKPNVKVYSTSTCPWCLVAKEFLHKNKIAFKDIDVSEDEEASRELVEKSGQMAVPVIEIDGQMVIGFDEPLLRKLLGIK